MARIWRIRNRALAGLLAALLGLAGGCASGPPEDAESAPVTAPGRTLSEAEAARTYEAVWAGIGRSLPEATLEQANAAGLRADYRERALAARSGDELRGVLRAMLEQLGLSHYALLPDAAPGEAPERGGEAVVGIEPWPVAGGGLAVGRVLEGTPAAQAGIGRGWLIGEVGGLRVPELAEELAAAGMREARHRFHLAHRVEQALSGPAGTRVALAVRPPGGKERRLTLERVPYPGELSPRLGNLNPMPMAFEARELAGGVRYVRFSLFHPALMGRLREALSGAGPAGVIMDVRGNPGGLAMMAGGVAGLLTQERFVLGTMRMREGHFNVVAFPQPGAYSGPVAVLMDARSASTAEIFALGLRELGRARLFGDVTAGAAMPSMIQTLPNGDRLQYAFAAYESAGGKSLEGTGVEPDEPVIPRARDLAAGRDPALEAAAEWLRERRSGEGKAKK